MENNLKSKKDICDFLVINLPFIIIGISFFIRTFFWEFYLAQFGEDGIVEYTQFIFYIFAFLFAVCLTVVNLRKGLRTSAFIYLLIALILFIISMEEISWGQRIFGFGTPEALQERNVQGELTLHNIDSFHKKYLHNAYILAGLIGSFGASIIREYGDNNLLRH